MGPTNFRCVFSVIFTKVETDIYFAKWFLFSTYYDASFCSPSTKDQVSMNNTKNSPLSHMQIDYTIVVVRAKNAE